MNITKEVYKRGGPLRLIYLSFFVIVLLFVILAGYWLVISPETFLERMISIGEWLLSLSR